MWTDCGWTCNGIASRVVQGRTWEIGLHERQVEERVTAMLTRRGCHEGCDYVSCSKALWRMRRGIQQSAKAAVLPLPGMTEHFAGGLQRHLLGFPCRPSSESPGRAMLALKCKATCIYIITLQPTQGNLPWN